MSGVIDSIERAQLRKVPNFQSGDRVKVHFQVVEGNRRRTQVFEGTVIKRQGSGARETFTVRKQSFGVGVERTFPVHTPKIERIEVASRGDVRRAKLYYLRGRVGRRARVRERQDAGLAAVVEPEMMDAAGTQEEAEVVDTAAGEDAAEVPPDSEAKTGGDDGESDGPPPAEAESDAEVETAGADAEPDDADGDAPEPPGEDDAESSQS